MTHHAGKFLVGNFLCTVHVNHIDMHMASTCSQNTVSIACLQCRSCHIDVVTCTITQSFTLASFMLQGVLSWLPCCLVSRVDIIWGSLGAPKHSPQGNHLAIMMNILSIWDLGNHAAVLTSASIHAPLQQKKLCCFHFVVHFHDTHSTLILVVQS